MPPERFGGNGNESGPEMYTWSFESTPEKAMEMADVIEARLLESGWTDEQLGNFKLAIHEGIVNAAMHGNEGDPAKKVTVELALAKNADEKEMAEITILDEGKGFDPEHIPNPTQDEKLLENHGRGIFIMAEETDVAPEFFPNQGKVILRRRQDHTSDGFQSIRKASV